MLASVFSDLDRVNLSCAALTMNAEPKFSPVVFAGVPALLHRLFILRGPALDRPHHGDLWGIISALMAVVSGPWSFCGCSPPI